MRGRCERRLLLVVVLLALAVDASAEDKRVGAPAGPTDLFQSLSLGSRKEPIHIDSDSLELDYKSSTITYRGNVRVTQGDVALTSDRLSIAYDRETTGHGGHGAAGASAPGHGDADKIKEVVAEGSVRIRRGDRLAEGRRAVFDQAKQTIVLSDGAVLHEGPNQVAGDRIIVYLQEERSVVEGGSKSRVTAVFYPGTSIGQQAGGTPGAKPETAGAGQER